MSIVTALGGEAGNGPTGTLVADASGNLYGTTDNGGPGGQGSVFEIAAGTHALSTIASFEGDNGADPASGLIIDAQGNLYGTTASGGASNAGTVFEISIATHALTTLVSFNGTNGAWCYGSLLRDSAGNLYGTTYEGGDVTDALSRNLGFGTVFEIAAGSRALTTLGEFTGPPLLDAGGNDCYPLAGLVMDSGGNLYGTTSGTGPGGYLSNGTLFEIAAGTRTVKTLVTFDSANGQTPMANLIMDGNGNLYGTTESGGENYAGTVFEFNTKTGALTTLATLGGLGFAGYYATSSLILDSSGDLFGTTEGGGESDSGTVYEIVAGSGTATTLADFYGGPTADHGRPQAGLVMDSGGDLYGTTNDDGSLGSVFELSPLPGTITGSSHYYVDVDSTSSWVQIYDGDDAGGSVLYSVFQPALGSTPLTFQTSGGSDDRLTIDYGQDPNGSDIGDPMAASGQFSFEPASGATNATLVVENVQYGTMSATSNGIVVDGQAIPTGSSVTNVQLDGTLGSTTTVNFTNNPFRNVSLDDHGGDTISLTGANSGATVVSYSLLGTNNTLNVSVANPYTISGDAASGSSDFSLNDSSTLTLVGSQNLSNLQIVGNGVVTIDRISPSIPSVVTTSGLSVGSSAALDLNDNAMVIYGDTSTTIGYIDGLLASGYAGGAWDGHGIRSSAAANDLSHSTGIGAIDNKDLAGLGGTPYSAFMGVPTDIESILLRYTYYGDTNLDGVVDASDVNNLDAGWGTNQGWLFGDFNYNETVNPTDVNLLDIGYGDQ